MLGVTSLVSAWELKELSTFYRRFRTLDSSLNGFCEYLWIRALLAMLQNALPRVSVIKLGFLAIQGSSPHFGFLENPCKGY